MTPPTAAAPEYRPTGTTVRRVRRPGMRGGAAYVDVPVAAVAGAARSMARRSVVYWSGAWAWAVALYILLVGRATELVPFASRIRPVALACLIALSVHGMRTPAATWRVAIRHPQFVRLGLYLALAVITLPFAIWKGGSAPLILVIGYGMVLTLAFLLTPADRQTFDRMTGLILVGAAICIGAIVAAGAVVEGSRLSSAGSYDANDLAAFADVLFILALGRATRGNLLHRLLFVGLAVLFVAVTLKTASRGGAIALAVGTVVFLLGLGGRRFFIALLVASLAVPVAWQAAPATFRERISTIGALNEDYNTTSTSGRSYIWRRGLVFFAQRPLIGVGPGNFETRLGQDFGSQGVTGAWHTAHNTVIQVFVELGVFGGVLLLTMIGSVLRETGRFWRPTWDGRRTALAKVGMHRPELFAAMAAYATAALFLSHAYSYLTFGIIALGAYAGRVRRDALGLV